MQTSRLPRERRSARGATQVRRYEVLPVVRDFDLLAASTGAGQLSAVPVKGDELYQRYDPDFAYRYVKAPTLTLAEVANAATAYIDARFAWS